MEGVFFHLMIEADNFMALKNNVHNKSVSNFNKFTCKKLGHQKANLNSLKNLTFELFKMILTLIFNIFQIRTLQKLPIKIEKCLRIFRILSAYTTKVIETEGCLKDSILHQSIMVKSPPPSNTHHSSSTLSHTLLSQSTIHSSLPNTNGKANSNSRSKDQQLNHLGISSNQGISWLNLNWTNTPSLLTPKKTITLVLDLDETLVHSSYWRSRNHDYMIEVMIDKHACLYYVYKRPYLDEFLTQVSG